MEMTKIHAIPTSCAISLTRPCVSSVHRRVVEGSGVGSVGLLCILMFMESELFVTGNVITTEYGRYSLSCIQKQWSACTVLSLYGCWSYADKFYC